MFRFPDREQRRQNRRISPTGIAQVGAAAFIGNVILGLLGLTDDALGEALALSIAVVVGISIVSAFQHRADRRRAANGD